MRGAGGDQHALAFERLHASTEQVFNGGGNLQRLGHATEAAFAGFRHLALVRADECDAVGFDVKLKTVYSSNGEGTLTIIKEESANKFVVAQVLKTEKGARTQAVDQLTHKIYLPTADFAPKDPKSFRPQSIPGTFRVLVVTP